MITPLDILSLETWILIISVIVLARWYIHRRWQVLKNLGIPHDPPSILGMGNLSEFFKNPQWFITVDMKRIKKYGLIYGSYLGLQPRICIADPDILKQIMIKEASTFRDRQKTFNKINGKEMNTALTSASGEQWKRIRHTLTPTFSTSKLKDMIPLFEECTDKTIEVLYKASKENNGRFDARDLFGKLSMDVICSSAFGVNVNSQEKETELVTRTKKLFSQSFFGIIAFLVTLFPWIESIAEKFNVSMFDKEILAYYKRLFDSVIKGKKAAGDKARVDIMQTMLTAEISEDEAAKEPQKGITRTEILGNALIMLMAGYETTANTMVFLAYCIAQEPEVQENLLKEIDETKEKHGGLTYEAINDMKYLDMCFKESMRMYGAAPRNSRYTDVEITVKGITIPAGTHVDIPVYALHHSEEYWNDPSKFVPERFEDMSKIDPIVYQPFGAGPRNCIGMRFAILEVKMAICKIISNFKLGVCADTPAPPLTMIFLASVQPKDDVFLHVSPRNPADVPA